MRWIINTVESNNMPELKDLLAAYSELFRNSPTRRNKSKEDYFFSFECGKGWYDLLESLMGVLEHTLSRYEEVVNIKNSILKRGEPIPSWIEEYFAENSTNPLEYFYIAQIKQKFGGLRFYVSFDGVLNNDIINHCKGAIQLAESLSWRICEVCGNPGTMITARQAVLCEKHLI